MLFGKFSFVFNSLLFFEHIHIYFKVFIYYFYCKIFWKSSCIEYNREVCYRNKCHWATIFYSSSKKFSIQKKIFKNEKKSKKLLVERYDEDSTRLLVTRLVSNVVKSFLLQR